MTLPLIDLHQDIILSFADSIEGFTNPELVKNLHQTYAGGLDAYQTANIRIVRSANRPYILEGDLEDHQHRKIIYNRPTLDHQHNATLQLIQRYNLGQILSFQDVKKALDPQNQTLYLLHHIEGIDDLRDTATIEQLYTQGIRSIGFVRNFDNQLAHCNLNQTDGLTELGKQTIHTMNELGMIVDTAHMNHASMMDTLRVSKKPILNSHSNLWTLNQHSRNVRDDFLAAIKDTGSVLGLSIYKGFIRSVSEKVMITDYLDQIDYVIKNAGPDSVALGTDFHGLPTHHCLEDLHHISQLKQLRDAVIDRFGDELARKFFFENAIRVLEENL